MRYDAPAHPVQVAGASRVDRGADIDLKLSWIFEEADWELAAAGIAESEIGEHDLVVAFWLFGDLPVAVSEVAECVAPQLELYRLFRIVL